MPSFDGWLWYTECGCVVRACKVKINSSIEDYLFNLFIFYRTLLNFNDYLNIF